MEERQKMALRRQQMALVDDLEPRGGVLDALLEDGVLTENDCERIEKAPTRRDRCQLLLHLIPTRGPTAYGSFRRALQSCSYGFLANMLQEELGETNEGRNGNRTVHIEDKGQTRAKSLIDAAGTAKCCQNCSEFLKNILCDKDPSLPHLNMIIEEVGCVILDNIEPVDVIDRLYQDEVIGTDDVDLVRSGTTRRRRCELLLQILVKKPSQNAVDSMTRALSKKYMYIADLLQGVANNVGQTNEIEATTCKGLYTKQPDEICCRTQPKSLENVDYGEQGNICMENTANKTRALNGDTECLIFDETDGGNVRNYSLQKMAEQHSDKVTCTTNDTTKRNKQKKLTKVHETTRDTSPPKDSMASLCTSMAVIPSQASHKSHRLTVAFNYLSTLINQGEFVKYENMSLRLKQKSPRNHDLLCIIGYLNASRDLFRTDFDSAKRNIQSTMALVPRTSNPRYFLLELFTAKTRMYITQKKLEKLQTTLDEAMQVMETDPEGCTGRAAGWLYINDARNKTAQLSCLNLSKPSAIKSYELLFVRAKTSFQRSMNNFLLDGGKDGPFGFGYALCRLVILLLRCGDNGLTMATLTPPEKDVHTAGQYLQHLENSDTPIPKILDMHLSLAKCDYHFRRGHMVRSLQHAQTAYDLATELNMLEFTEHAHNRLKFLLSKAPPGGDGYDVSEEEVQEILFGHSTESEETSYSD